MRIGNLDGRLVLVTDGGAVDIERASGGLLPADPAAAFGRWDDVVAWAAAASHEPAPFAAGDLRAPSPEPRQVFAIGVNYHDHATEGGVGAPPAPVVFTKFPTCITGPYAEVPMPDGSIDYEAELVVVIGRRAERVPAARAWDHVAGVCAGQDLSERGRQMSGPYPQFSLGKSFPGFGPTGPWLVTPDELENPDDLGIGCLVNGEAVQKARTSEMIFGVPALVEYLSRVCPLLPGDVIFTGTPGGVGFVRQPPVYLKPGDEVTTTIEGVGTLRNRMVAAEAGA